MNTIKKFVLALVVLVGLASVPAAAGNTDPLFVNMTTDDMHRSDMAIHFATMQAKLGHPVTIFLNDKGVLVGAKTNASRYPDQQKALAAMMEKGAVVIACPFCMRQYGVPEQDLLPGIKIGSPEVTGGALFKDNTRTLTW
jgi:sulfur relay (sulfurtransferase) complex TusBCD TusD component (DsrE family)